MNKLPAGNFASFGEQQKKQREYDLIEAFLAICSDFDGWKFSFYDENPDLVYEKEGHQLGFESVVISADDQLTDCYFDAMKCELKVPPLKSEAVVESVRAALATHLLDHLRHYKLPTVIVLTIIDETLALSELAESLRLPELTVENIQDYYLANSQSVYKIPETQAV